MESQLQIKNLTSEIERRNTEHENDMTSLHAEHSRNLTHELKTLETEFEAKLTKQGAENTRFVVTIAILAVFLAASLVALAIHGFAFKYRNNASQNKNKTQSDAEQGLLLQQKKEVRTTEIGTNTDTVHEDCVKESKLITQDTQCHPVSVDEMEGSQDPDNISTPNPASNEIRLH